MIRALVPVEAPVAHLALAGAQAVPVDRQEAQDPAGVPVAQPADLEAGVLVEAVDQQAGPRHQTGIIIITITTPIRIRNRRLRKHKLILVL